MRKLIAFAIISMILLFGCVQVPKVVGAQGSSFDKNFAFGPFSNNTTNTSTGELITTLTKHAYTVVYAGNWTNALANVTLQGSLDNSNWFNISSVYGNTDTYTSTLDYPLNYVRFKITQYNASTNSSIASLTIKYSGTSVDSTDTISQALVSANVTTNVRIDTLNASLITQTARITSLNSTVASLNLSKRDLSNNTFSVLIGVGNAYVCVDKNGTLSRSNTTCV